MALVDYSGGRAETGNTAIRLAESFSNEESVHWAHLSDAGRGRMRATFQAQLRIRKKSPPDCLLDHNKYKISDPKPPYHAEIPLPSRNIFNFSLAECASFHLLRFLLLRGPVHRLSRHDMWQFTLQEVEEECVDLLKLQQEGIMTFRAIDGLELADQRRLLDQREGVSDLFRKRLVGGVCSAPRDVVGVKLACDGNVAVSIKTLDEFVALVAQVRLFGSWLHWRREEILRYGVLHLRTYVLLQDPSSEDRQRSSPQLMPHALYLADVAIGMMLRT
ncbi:Homoserine [Hortaea werneckii]|nr:Homoserine [Hortaea werneckii]